MTAPSSTEATTAERLATLETSLAQWDARVLAYDAARFDFADRILAAARTLRPEVRSLETIHRDIPDDAAYALSKDLCRLTRAPDFAEMVRRFVVEVLAPESGLEGALAVQRFLNVRIMLPNQPQAVFPFHTGLLYGHGPASRSLWLPLTDVRAREDWTASLQIIDLERSRRLIAEAQRRRAGIDEMATLFRGASHPVSAGPGEVLLFTQEHIHGNVTNETGKTRVSIDFRVAESRFGDMLARKVAGGYFAPIEDESGRSQVAPPQNALRNLVYLNNSTPYTDGIPVHLQRLMVRDYCEQRDLPVHFEYFELEGMDHLPTLAHAVDSLDCNVLLYSVYALPTEPSFRDEILRRAVERNLVLHFVNEDVVVHDDASRARLEGLLQFARFDSASPSAEHPVDAEAPDEIGL
ncbi:MAG: hypothetical protein AAGB93_18150 [Planctomycetota bacterium]